MVKALVKGKRIEIRNLDDLSEVTEQSRLEREALILIIDGDERFEIPPSAALPDAAAARRRAAFEAAFGSVKDRRSLEEIDRSIREGRSSRARGWPDSQFEDLDDA